MPDSTTTASFNIFEARIVADFCLEHGWVPHWDALSADQRKEFLELISQLYLQREALNGD